MVDLLASQYQSVFSEPKQPIEDQSSLFPDERLEKRLTDIYIDECDIIEAIGVRRQ